MPKIVQLVPQTLLEAIQQDNVNILRSTFNWIEQITEIGVNIFYIIGLEQHKAAKCLKVILTECPALDPMIDWFYHEDDSIQWTNPVIEAINCGYVELTAVYLKHATVPIENFTQQLITRRVTDDHVDILRLFIDHRPAFNLNVDCSDVSSKLTMLMITAQLGYCRMTQLLVDASPRVNIDAVDVEGESALWYATHFRHAKCVQILLNGQASAILVDLTERTTDSITETLIEKLVKESLLQRQSGTVVHISDVIYNKLMFEATYEIAIDHNSIDMLINYPNWAQKMTRILSGNLDRRILMLCNFPGAHDVLDAIFTHCGSFPVNDYHRLRSEEIGEAHTMFLHAVKYGSAAIVRVFLKHAASRCIDLTQRAGYPSCQTSSCPVWWYGPVALAVKEKRLDILEMLMNHPDFDVNDSGMTTQSIRTTEYKATAALLIAVGGPRPTPTPHCERSAEFVRILLTDKRIDVNIRDDYGYTALMYAVMQNDVELVGLLLTNDTELSAKAPNGNTAAQFATPKTKRKIRDFAAARRRRNEEEGKENARVVNKITTKSQAAKISSSSANLLSRHGNQTEQSEVGIALKPSTASAAALTKTSTATAVKTAAPKKAQTSGSICARIQHNGRLCHQCLSTTVVNTVLQPCNHLAMCQNCVHDARKNKRFSCPMCKQRVMKYVSIRL